ncbi:serine/threonine-protein kinase DCLK3 isoform 1-T1 [Menidia menidia]
MAPSHKDRQGCEAARNTKWRLAAPPVPVSKRPAVGPRPWPVHLHPAEQEQSLRPPFPLPPPPNLPVFHTRHAEESAERPHLVTVVRPSQSELRKVTVLLNRRGVVSFEQLLSDISEALGFPRWHRARVTRLYTTHAREVKGVCGFFCGHAAFLALGKARPELEAVREALEELFPEHSHYRANALRAWEKKLRPPPDKAAKADSGYGEETDAGGPRRDAVSHADTPPTQNGGSHQQDPDPDPQKPHRKSPWRKPPLLPNNLQRLHARGGTREPVIGAPKLKDGLRADGAPPPVLCESCFTRRAKPEAPDLIGPGRAPLPPLSNRKRGGSHKEEKDPDPPVRGEKPGLSPDQAPDPVQQREGSGGLSLSDIERRYEIGRVVGDGNFAVVRECRRRGGGGGKSLAMKIVQRSRLAGREHMMQNELSLLGSLSHPRVVRLLEHHHTHTHSYLLMELVAGGDLFDAISRSGRFSEAEAGLMVSDVSEALSYIHGRSIVHRDLKPENLLIEPAAGGILRLKLGDFGLAMVVTEPVFTICGTPTYVAPEILCETGYGVAVDVWALGVILYILLCGFPPFRSRDRDQEELFKLIKQAQLHFPSPYWDSISEEARELVTCLLQPDPSLRITAEKTLLHQWVKAMASVCQQGALTDRRQKEKAEASAERGRRTAPENGSFPASGATELHTDPKNCGSPETPNEPPPEIKPPLESGAPLVEASSPVQKHGPPHGPELSEKPPV